jgi:uncharacterized protein (DUF2249 family)
MAEDATVTVDVREDISQGRQPFDKIMEAAGRLGSNESLRLITPFKPEPLFGMLAAEGFSHQMRQTASGDWEVLFSRTRETKLTSASSRACSQSPIFPPACETTPTDSAVSDRIELDTRGLEPPQPMIAILEALGDLGAGGELRAITSRRPMHLYAALEERGFHGRTEERPDGSFITLVRRA